jgi:hypothetical protein
MVRWGLADDERAWFRLDAATDVWDGEQTGPR